MESASDSEPPRADGRIPFTFRIGVTGHRDLADPDTLRMRIREAIVQLLAIVPVASRAGLALVVVTALARERTGWPRSKHWPPEPGGR